MGNLTTAVGRSIKLSPHHSSGQSWYVTPYSTYHTAIHWLSSSQSVHYQRFHHVYCWGHLICMWHWLHPTSSFGQHTCVLSSVNRTASQTSRLLAPKPSSRDHCFLCDCWHLLHVSWPRTLFVCKHLYTIQDEMLARVATIWWNSHKTLGNQWFGSHALVNNLKPQS